MISRNVLVTVIVVSVGLPALAAAPKKADKGAPSREAVAKILRQEIFAAVDRRATLAEALAKDPNSNLVRWQSGYVQEGKTWHPAEDPGRSTEDEERVRQYREHRDAAPQTAEGQFEVANWCRKHKLADRERAHLIAAMTLSPDEDHTSIYERMGYHRVGNHWLNREQIAQWHESNVRALAAFKHWGARLQKVAEKLDGSVRQHDAGVASLRQFTEVEAIPAMEYILCSRDEAAALAGVDAFQKFEGYEGTLALTKQAVFSQWPKVREQATKSLKGRRLEDFAPALIGLLVTPITVKTTSQRTWFAESGRPGIGALALTTSYVLARETDDQFQVETLKTVDFRLSAMFAGSTVNSNGQPGGARRSTTLQTLLDGALSANDADRALATENYERSRAVELAVDRLNERTSELNRRIVGVLASISERDSSPEPAVWWKWWADYTDTQQAGGKSVVVVSEEEVLGDPTVRLRWMECFVVGTPVWTDNGPLSIETIQVGDRVLSQDIETGELTYKPVLRTTVRPAKPLVRVKIGDETITATGGHRFWVAGDGWTKARDLKPQSLVHTVTGNAPIRSVETEPAAETYNLVVADFHDYFVGRAGVLVQDLPLPQPTNTIVPGLTRIQHDAASK